ncbi:Hypothetical predicted protein [Olea europaea subsp. europaea]|nr:Hypothetical predicted protein [Olea europaea subsp. europaea]
MKFSGAREESKEESSSIRDGKIKPQKTQSFRGEKKKSLQGWMRKRFSRSMSWDYDFRGEDYPVAVAAAAFAVESHEESTTMDQEKIPDYTTVGPAPSFREKPTSSDKKTTTTNKPEEACGGTTVRPAAPSFKKTPTISEPTSDIHLTEAVPPKNDAAGKTPSFPAPLPPPSVQIEQSSRKPGPGETDADAWEKAEMARIKQRHQKKIMVIENWANKKKKKAKNKLDRIQAELDKRRTRAMQSYHSDMKRIEDIAKGASANADKNRTNEEYKVKDKANKIRSTGKLPVIFICC